MNLEPVIRVNDGIDRAVHQGLVEVQDQGQFLAVSSLALFRQGRCLQTVKNCNTVGMRSKELSVVGGQEPNVAQPNLPIHCGGVKQTVCIIPSVLAMLLINVNERALRCTCAPCFLKTTPARLAQKQNDLHGKTTSNIACQQSDMAPRWGYGAGSCVLIQGNEVPREYGKCEKKQQKPAYLWRVVLDSVVRR